MTVSEDAFARASLRSVLTTVGVSTRPNAREYVIDLAGLDNRPVDPQAQSALRTSASLLFRFAKNASVVATMPQHEDRQRELAASGMMFALAQLHARITFPNLDPDLQEQSELLSRSTAQALGNDAAWRSDYSPASVELRNLLLGAAKTDTTIDATPQARRLMNFAHLGIVDRDFAAFVNPHRNQNGDVLAAVSQVAAPWLRRVLAGELRDGEQSVHKTIEVLEHALENVTEHAFNGTQQPRSLITIGRTVRGTRRMLRLQVLDNGIGLPASIALQRSENEPDLPGAVDYVQRAVLGNLPNNERLLPGARGRGIPAMRKIAAGLGGQLDITTAGPGGTQIVVECTGDADIEPYADRMPVAGTIVTLWVPLRKTEQTPHASAAAQPAQSKKDDDLLPFGQ